MKYKELGIFNIMDIIEGKEYPDFFENVCYVKDAEGINDMKLVDYREKVSLQEDKVYKFKALYSDFCYAIKSIQVLYQLDIEETGKKEYILVNYKYNSLKYVAFLNRFYYYHPEMICVPYRGCIRGIGRLKFDDGCPEIDFENVILDSDVVIEPQRIFSFVK